jgi:hypothetical protein
MQASVVPVEMHLVGHVADGLTLEQIFFDGGTLSGEPSAKPLNWNS